MKIDEQIEKWAHMLDESFNKMSEEEKIESKALPKDENTKFKFGDVFTSDLDTNDKVLEIFDAIWPKWYDYFSSTIGREKDLELEGRQRDVDDWDVWRISVEDCYDGIENMVHIMFEDIFETYADDAETTLKEIIDDQISRFIDGAADNISTDELEEKGVCIYKGRMHWGGRYPG